MNCGHTWGRCWFLQNCINSVKGGTSPHLHSSRLCYEGYLMKSTHRFRVDYGEQSGWVKVITCLSLPPICPSQLMFVALQFQVHYLCGNFPDSFTPTRLFFFLFTFNSWQDLGEQPQISWLGSYNTAMLVISWWIEKTHRVISYNLTWKNLQQRLCNASLELSHLLIRLRLDFRGIHNKCSILLIIMIFW